MKHKERTRTMPMTREEATKILMEQNITNGGVQKTPLFKMILGSAMLLIMIIVSCFSVLTTQDLIKGGHGEGVILRWQVFMQPFDLMQGAFSGKEEIAIIVSWALFVLYLVFGAMEVVTPDNRKEDKFFKTMIGLLLFLDGTATYNYLTILPWWYQILFTILVPICIAFFGKFGLTLVLSSIHDFMKGKSV